MARNEPRSFAKWVELANTKHDSKYTYLELFQKGVKPWLKAVCSEHGEFEVDASFHLSALRGCKKCSLASRAAKGRITLEEFTARARQVHGDRYEYVNLGVSASGRSTIVAVCREHGEFTQLANHHLITNGCKDCSRESFAAKQKFTREKWLERFAEVWEGRYTYGKYVDGKVPRVEVVCPKHGVEVKSAQRHAVGDGCTKCGHETMGKALEVSDEELYSRFQSAHGDKYTYGRIYFKETPRIKVVEVICPEHGTFVQSVKLHANGQGCRACGIAARARASRYTMEDLLPKFREVHGELYGYGELLDSTETSPARIVAICPTHGPFPQLVTDHLAGCGCPNCGNRISKPNKEIAEYLESLGLDVELEFCLQGEARKYYADVLVGSHKLVIEFLGLYWHSSKFKDSNALADRQKAFESAGYNFIAIYEDEWITSKEAVKSTLKAKVGMFRGGVFARKCKVQPLTIEQARRFLEKHHLQGFAAGEALGLFNGEELVACAVFNGNCSNRNAAEESVGELARYATSGKVLGGLGRLLAAYRKSHPEIMKIVTFSDNRIHKGMTYEKLGFNKLYSVKPDYRYVKGKKRLHKANYQKSRLAKLFPGTDLTKTEKEIAEANGLYRIYDTGKTKWELVTPSYPTKKE